MQQGSDGIGILRVTGNSDADGEGWLFGIVQKKIANPLRHQRGGSYACLWQDQGKLVPALPRCGIYGPATVRQDLRQPAKRPVSRQMPKSIVDLFQSIQVQQKKREFSLGALGSADLGLQHIEKTAMIGQAR